MLNGYKWAFDQPKTVSQNRRCILMGKNLMTIEIGPVTSGTVSHFQAISHHLGIVMMGYTDLNGPPTY